MCLFTIEICSFLRLQMQCMINVLAFHFVMLLQKYWFSFVLTLPQVPSLLCISSLYLLQEIQINATKSELVRPIKFTVNCNQAQWRRLSFEQLELVTGVCIHDKKELNRQLQGQYNPDLAEQFRKIKRRTFPGQKSLQVSIVAPDRAVRVNKQNTLYDTRSILIKKIRC